MGTLSVTSFISLDGVMQAPGLPDEDRSNGFTHGGWLVPYMDEAFGSFMAGIFESPAAFLLGRKTYDIFASYWPKVTQGEDVHVAKKLDGLHKYVVTSHSGTSWGPVTPLGADLEAEISKVKSKHTGEIQVHGSAQLARSLLGAGLVDKLNLVIAPVLLGAGKRLFGTDGSSGWTLIRSQKSSSGLLLNQLTYAGEVKHGAVPDAK